MSISSLKTQADFDLVNKLGKRLFCRHFIAVVLSQGSDNFTMSFGMKVSKKLGNAVIRNKIKRRIRHLIRLMSSRYINAKLNINIILIPKKHFEKIPFTLLLENITSAFNTLILL